MKYIKLGVRYFTAEELRYIADYMDNDKLPIRQSIKNSIEIYETEEQS